MKENARIIANRLKQITGVDDRDKPKSARFKLISKYGVIWNETRNKWGNIHYGASSNILIALDYPINRLSNEYFRGKISLSEKNPRERLLYYTWK